LLDPVTPDIEQQRKALAAQLRRLGATDEGVPQTVDVLARSWPATPVAMATDELLLEALRTFPVMPVWFEQRMTDVRRRLLYSSATPGIGPLLAAVAIQCQLNEYAWAEDPGETEFLARLVAAPDDLTPEQAMALACYRPLAEPALADVLLAKGWTGPVEDVLREQILAVREEWEIEASLPAITPIREGMSQEVRAQYEVHPYPRWRRSPTIASAREIAGRPPPVKPRALVAGCGTGRQAIQAAQYLDAETTVAVDLSRRSLAYAIRKTREAGLSGIAYAQADILELPELFPEAFDVVTCTGVLHHMADPFEGARALCRTLKPGGLLNLGLYSKTARRGLQPAKDLAATYTAETVRQMRQAVINGADEGLQQARRARDFYATSGARDLLMHVNEQQMSFADLRRIFEENRLRFLGFIHAEPIMALYRSMYPHDPGGLDLDAWEAFESVHSRAFARMYMFWAERLA
jgi:ubiquinone/menaquinone biosynthesis C-methylase UbiE